MGKGYIMKEIILASQSPRRKELLEKCNVSFLCDPAAIDETLHTDLSLAEAVAELSYRKAASVLERHPEALVIGSDTIVTIHDRVLGKPKDEEEAYAMLESLQGNTHQVITGICFLSQERKYVDKVVSHVTFASMEPAEILAYIATGEYKDKAGAYGIQGFGGRYIEHIDGDYYAIMGLPLHLVYKELQKQNLY